MQRKTFILFLVGACFLTTTHAQNNDTCDIGLQPIPSLDLDRLHNKKWFVQEILYRRPEAVVEPAYECVTQTLVPYYLTEDFGQLVELYREIGSGRATHNTSFAIYQGLGEEQAIWRITTDVYIDQYTAVWTHTDYDSYGVMHWCPVSASADHNFERVLTFTGVPEPDQALLEEVRRLVASLGFPTENAVQIDHHSGCDYGLCEAVDEERCCDPSGVPNVPPMPDIELDRFLYGPGWYVQEIFFREPETSTTVPSCYVQWFGPNINNRIVIYEIFTPLNSSSNDQTDLLAIPGLTGSEVAVWQVISQFTLNQFTTVITHTDYANYGVMHWCPHLENADQRAERILVLTEAQTPDEALLQELREKVRSLGFPIEHGVRIHHHADCDYYQYVDDDDDEEEKKILVNDDFDD